MPTTPAKFKTLSPPPPCSPHAICRTQARLPGHSSSACTVPSTRFWEGLRGRPLYYCSHRQGLPRSKELTSRLMFMPDVQHAGLGALGHRAPPKACAHCPRRGPGLSLPSEKSRTCLSAPPSFCSRVTSASLPEQYKLLSDHIEQMATE